MGLGRQTTFDAEAAAIEAAVRWYQVSPFTHAVIHTDSTSAIARASHTGAGPAQRPAREIHRIIGDLRRNGRSAELGWVKGHAGTPGNERADSLAGQATNKTPWARVTSLAYLKLRISENFGREKDKWHADPSHHGADEIPPPKKSCMDRTRNAIAKTAAQITTGHWRSAVYLKRIRKRGDDRCWFCQERKMTRSHALLHCTNAKLRAAREEAWDGKHPGSIRVLLMNPR